jgi:hypothetical protein
MIFEEPELGRFAFVFDMNDRLPFRSQKYFWGTHTLLHPVIWCISDEFYEFDNIPERFQELIDWLSERTTAFQVKPMIMHALGWLRVRAIVAYVPEDLAPLFRLFWYDG